MRAAGEIALEYDENGNMTRRARPGTTLNIEYTLDNKPEIIIKNGIPCVQYVYDASGRRIKKKNFMTGTTVSYFGEVYEVRNNVGIIHVFAGSQRVASIRSDGGEQYYHSNHLGSASVITDRYGDQSESIEYYPFGAYRVRNSIANPVPNAKVNYTFTGQEDDDETGLYNFNARLYDPELGRFISADSIVPEPGNLQAFNRYSYCVNNPLIYTDPSGYIFGIDDLIIVGVCMAIGALMAGAQSNWNVQAMAAGAIIGGISAGVGIGVGGMFSNALTGAIVGGAAGGMVGGGLNAAYYGGNIGEGMLKGAAFGAAAGALMYGAVRLYGWASGGTPTTASNGGVENGGLDKISNDISVDKIADGSGGLNDSGTVSQCTRPLNMPGGEAIYNTTGVGHEFFWFGNGEHSYGYGLGPGGGEGKIS